MDHVNIGSIWRKWDLHVHTPASFFWKGGKLLRDMNEGEREQAIRTFIKTINESDIAAFCTMDYWTFDWCIALKQYLKKSPGELKKPVFNGMELRVECSTDYRLNIHVLLSDELTEQQLNDFKSTLQIRIGPSNKNLSDEALMDFAKSLAEDKAKVHSYDDPATLSDDKLLELGSKTAEATRDSLLEAFKHIPADSGYIILPFDTYGGLDKLDWKTHPQDANFFMQLANIFESRDCKNIDLFTGKKTEDNKLYFDNFHKTLGGCSKPCVSGSDAHAFGEYGIYPSDSITWIKADPTFEGLKQIIYEPASRISIGTASPPHSPNIIESFSFKLPTTSKVGKEEFCFAGLEKKFHLSPYFNCFVGGRGTGKSTILNFFGIHSIHPDSSIEFWRDLSPKDFTPTDSLVFQTEGTEIFEFLGQSEVEGFARDKTRFTQAIYDRANSRSGNELKRFEQSVEEHQANFDIIIQNIAELHRLEELKQNAEKEKRTLEKGLSIASSEEYKTLASIITEKANELQALREWRERIEELRHFLEEFSAQEESTDTKDASIDGQMTETTMPEDIVTQVNKSIDAYNKAYRSAITKIEEAETILQSGNFSHALLEEASLTQFIQEKENEAKEILEKAGLSPENVTQVKSAPQKITFIDHELTKLNQQIEAKKKSIKRYEIVLGDLRRTKDNYEKELSTILQPLRDILESQFTENQGRDIKKISLEYSFDLESAWKTATEAFYLHFKAKYGNGERSDDVCDFIYKYKDIFKENNPEDVRTLLQKEEKNNKYLDFLSEIFSDDNNFLIFCSIRDKHLYDVKKYKLIQVTYDERDIENASFGQRCTAVIVILLLFGNYPLIIDEPEAHLDSSLIANYLVPLLKRKKADRQIIFATHNANFVVNGDAEKIFVLEVPLKTTQFIETTIENLDHRERLLNLEGGEEAFLTRKNKYHC